MNGCLKNVGHTIVFGTDCMSSCRDLSCVRPSQYQSDFYYCVVQCTSSLYMVGDNLDIRCSSSYLYLPLMCVLRNLYDPVWDQARDWVNISGITCLFDLFWRAVCPRCLLQIVMYILLDEVYLWYHNPCNVGGEDMCIKSSAMRTLRIIYQYLLY